MAINGRRKGAAAEREAAKWLATTFNLSAIPQRNLEQVRSGGHDLLGFPPFAFEIKRCETLSLRQWWVQAVNACTEEYYEPVVMFRRSRRTWTFLISAKHIGLNAGFITLQPLEFKKWVNNFIDNIALHNSMLAENKER